MKAWKKPEMEVLNVAATAHAWIGIYKDGGYIGDGEISGHLSWTKPESNNNNNNPTPTPTNNTPDMFS
ncbi:hypothetical protein SAMN05216249_11441 [Acetitomaculum ruminis DSM 5522]|uniref:Uncharacterized protein n=1 Tax=Acetitomaculum ruminis DSM 5522 TaxID=1120918 RepID=A0A1I0ZBY7_9FIRM|nr:hypothetical protein [Acetitomaculum ruminis]SFB23154.1 hypothetical protein SAMN05216249_11441 [Acetitomaculum ruminis DSM 5522]